MMPATRTSGTAHGLGPGTTTDTLSCECTVTDRTPLTATNDALAGAAQTERTQRSTVGGGIRTSSGATNAPGRENKRHGAIVTPTVHLGEMPVRRSGISDQVGVLTAPSEGSLRADHVPRESGLRLQRQDGVISRQGPALQSAPVILFASRAIFEGESPG